jgi:hypothetical protein
MVTPSTRSSDSSPPCDVSSATQVARCRPPGRWMSCSTSAERRLVRQVGDDRRDVRCPLQAKECLTATPFSPGPLMCPNHPADSLSNWLVLKSVRASYDVLKDLRNIVVPGHRCRPASVASCIWTRGILQVGAVRNCCLRNTTTFGLAGWVSGRYGFSLRCR